MNIQWGYWLLILMAALLFVGGPDAESHRIYKEVWDTGHLFLFAGVSWVMLSLPIMKHRTWIVMLAVTTGVCLVAGAAIEVLQLMVGRNLELKDLVNDLLGGYLGLALFITMQDRWPVAARVAMLPLMLLIVVIVFRPLSFAVMDQYIMQDEFPILADFETPYELDRWDTMLADLSVDDSTVRYGEKSMRVDFEPGEYPDISLINFVSDWQGFEILKFSVFNSSDQARRMELKIYDWQHLQSGYEYEDRFNRELSIEPGWNDIVVTIEDIRQAPKGRDMNMSDIATFSLFLHKLEQPLTMYFDSLRLSSKPQ